MKQYLSNEVINHLHTKCAYMINQFFSVEESSSTGTQRLDASILIDKIAWDVLVPFIMGVVSGLTIEALKARFFDKKDKESSKDKIFTLMGMEITDSVLIKHEQWVLLIHESAKQFGLTKNQSEKLMNHLLEELKKIDKE